MILLLRRLHDEEALLLKSKHVGSTILPGKPGKPSATVEHMTYECTMCRLHNEEALLLKRASVWVLSQDSLAVERMYDT